MGDDKLHKVGGKAVACCMYHFAFFSGAKNRCFRIFLLVLKAMLKEWKIKTRIQTRAKALRIFFIPHQFSMCVWPFLHFEFNEPEKTPLAP